MKSQKKTGDVLGISRVATRLPGFRDHWNRCEFS